jgi:hypothetical protein
MWPIVLISAILLLTAAATFVQYRRSKLAIENFQDDDLWHLKCCGKDWQIKRLEVRANKLGWHAVDHGSEARGVQYVVFQRDSAESATLIQLLKRLHRSGYYCEPVRHTLDIKKTA